MGGCEIDDLSFIKVLKAKRPLCKINKILTRLDADSKLKWYCSANAVEEKSFRVVLCDEEKTAVFWSGYTDITLLNSTSH